MSERLFGKVCIITGTGGSIGREAALTFAREGALVVGCDLQVEAAQSTVEAVRAAAGSTRFRLSWTRRRHMPRRSASTPRCYSMIREKKSIMERIKKIRVSNDALDLVFRKARTYNAWLPKPVPEELLRQLYDTLKWGLTSANISPARFVFIRSTAAKQRLRPSLAPGNVQKTMAAPVTVIIAYGLKFYDKLPRLFPHFPAMRDMFVNNPQLIQETALRTSTLQGAYMTLAARALGLDSGPMSGFDNAKLDEEFFAAGKCESCEQEFFPEGHVKSNFLCNIGYGDPATLMPRGPRLDFSEACTLL